MPTSLRYFALFLSIFGALGACETRSVPLEGNSRSDGWAFSLEEREKTEYDAPTPKPRTEETGSFWSKLGEREEKSDSASQRYRITNAGQLYSTINRTDCLSWPSEEIKSRAGSDAWGGYYPQNGDVGTLVGTSIHCSSGVKVYILNINGYYVPIGESGVTPEAGTTSGGSSASVLYEITNAGQIYPSINTIDCLNWPSEDIKRVAGTNGWGSYYPRKGEVGTLVGSSPHCHSPSTTVYILNVKGYYVPIGSSGVKESGTIGTGAMVSIFGADEYKITDAGQLYSTINQTDCLSWPSEEIKAKAGSDSWGGFYPQNGDVGTLVGTSIHCSSGVKVYILNINGYYVPIGESGITLVTH